MKMTNSEYKKYVDAKTGNSPCFKNLLRAFIVGGIICCIGQGLSDGFGAMGLDKESAATAVSVTLVFIGVFLTDIGVYDDIARFAGGGTLVPITGFANSMAAPALEFQSEGRITGTCAKMFTIAGPVIVLGVSASVVYGIILVLIGG